MQLTGLVSHAVDGSPIAQAQVVLRIGERSIGTFYTDDGGGFHVSDASDELMGQQMTIDVSKAGFQLTSVSRTVDSAFIELKIELSPTKRPPPPRPPPPPPPQRTHWWWAVGAIAAAAGAVAIVQLMNGPSPCPPGEAFRDGTCMPIPEAEPVCPEGEHEVHGICQSVCAEGEGWINDRCRALPGPRTLAVDMSRDPSGTLRSGERTTIRISVSDAQRAPVAGAQVTLSAVEGDFEGQRSVEGRTGADGTFATPWRCGSCEAGTYTIEAQVRSADSPPVSESLTVAITKPHEAPAPEPGKPPKVSLFSATPQEISAGQSATLRWEVSSASSVSVEPGLGTVPASGSRVIRPAVTTTYTLKARNSYGSTQTSSTVQVSKLLELRVKIRADPASISTGEGTSIVVDVKNAAGSAVPLARVRIDATAGEFRSSPGNTLADGVFRDAWTCKGCAVGDYQVRAYVDKNGYASGEARTNVSIRPTQSVIRVVSAEIGCLDLSDNKGNLNDKVRQACEGRTECSYKAPEPKQLDAMKIRRFTRTFCTQAMWITYSCSQGTGTRTVKVAGDAWNHPAARMSCK